MSFNIKVDGSTSVRLPTAGKYCDRDIVITSSATSDHHTNIVAGGVYPTTSCNSLSLYLDEPLAAGDMFYLFPTYISSSSHSNSGVFLIKVPGTMKGTACLRNGNGTTVCNDFSSNATTFDQSGNTLTLTIKGSSTNFFAAESEYSYYIVKSQISSPRYTTWSWSAYVFDEDSDLYCAHRVITDVSVRYNTTTKMTYFCLHGAGAKQLYNDGCDQFFVYAANDVYDYAAGDVDCVGYSWNDETQTLTYQLDGITSLSDLRNAPWRIEVDSNLNYYMAIFDKLPEIIVEE